MAIDTPARIAIIGAGPIGLEAALYARFLGYDVELFEKGRVGEGILSWGHVTMFTPWTDNHSPLALAALVAQHGDISLPAADAMLTGREYVEQFLAPLANSDLLADGLHEHCEVIAIGKEDVLKSDLPGEEARGDSNFRLLVRDASGERAISADVVIDASGILATHQWLGQGGIPAVGELALESQLEYGFADVPRRERAAYEGMHTLVVGDGYQAALHVIDLATLSLQSPATRVTWMSRPCAAEALEEARSIPGPAPLAEHQQVIDRAESLFAGDNENLIRRRGVVVQQISYDAGSALFTLQLAGGDPTTLIVDRVIASVGHRPCRRLHAELQVREHFATSASGGWTPRYGDASAYGASPLSPATEQLIQPEPNFYILGAKSAGRDPRFVIRNGLDQIRAVFSLIGDRPDLNLYASAHKLG